MVEQKCGCEHVRMDVNVCINKCVDANAYAKTAVGGVSMHVDSDNSGCG